MAGKRAIKAKALVNIKYDDKCFEVGKEFKIREEDKDYLVDNSYVELVEATKPAEKGNDEDEGAGEGGEE